MQLLLQAEVRLTDLDAIAFGAGPGSFTGLRTACAVAQGLAFGAGLPVLPVDSLLAVAEQARFVHAPTQSTCCVTAVLDARMDEVYAATYCYAQGPLAQPGTRCLAGAAGCGAVVGLVGSATRPVVAGGQCLRRVRRTLG